MHDIQDLLDVHAEVPLVELRKSQLRYVRLSRDRVSRYAPLSEPDRPGGAFAPPRQRMNPIVGANISQGDLRSKQPRYSNRGVAFT